MLVKYMSCICLDSLMEKLLVEAQKMVVRLNLKAPGLPIIPKLAAEMSIIKELDFYIRATRRPLMVSQL